MPEYTPEANWYKVHLDTVAEFIAPGLSEAEAIESVIGYCDNNRFLQLDPDLVLPHGIWGKPLEPMDERFYSQIQARTNVEPVRLLNDKRTLPKPETKAKTQEIIVDENQLCLFAFTTMYRDGKRIELLSYYYE